MEFGQAGTPKHPHHLIFEGWEVGLMGAVFRETIYNLARRGNTGSISEYDASVAKWDNDATQGEMLVLDYTSVTEKLEEFHSNTDSAIGEIAELTGLPPYDNDYIPIRYDLGQKAHKLAEAINREAISVTSTDRLDEELAELAEEQGGSQH
jgi:hypothetical protein